MSLLDPSAPFDPRDATLGTALGLRARQWGAKPFLRWLPDGRAIGYDALDGLTCRVANGLDALGVAPGAHVAVLMDNCPEQLLAILGIARSGRVAVPLNSAAKGQLLRYFLDHADCAAVVVERALLARLADVVATLPRIDRIVVADVDRGPAERGPAPAAAASASAAAPASSAEVASALAARPLGRVAVDPFDALLDAPATEPPRPPRFSDVAMLMFTSGTTGPSKAIMFTHAHVVRWGLDVAHHHEYVPEDIAYVCLPLFHGNALLGSTMGSLMAGASIALVPRFSTSRFWSEVRECGATVFNGVGGTTNFLWARPPSPEDREHRVNRCHLAPVPGFAAEFEQRFGIAIMSAFGLTDYCLGAAYNTKSRRDKLGSCGLPRRGVELRIVDEHDLELPAGVPGEIVMRCNDPWGASIGYYKAPEATLASRRNLWFHTGDRGFVDRDGYVWYTDRLKDSIRRRGENISAFEVEEVVRSHPAVADVAVFPVRAETSEDEVACFVVLRPGVPWSPRDLVEHCGANLAYFMVPRYVGTVDAFPMTLSLKVEKYKLRAQAESDLGALWDREREGVVPQR